MGQDLARKSAPTFKKAWDSTRQKLKEGDLLTLIPEEPCAALVAEIFGDACPAEGDKVHIRHQVGGFFVDRDLMPIGKVIDPPDALLRRAKAGRLMLNGRVHAVHREAGFMEIVLS